MDKIQKTHFWISFFFSTTLLIFIAGGVFLMLYYQYQSLERDLISERDMYQKQITDNKEEIAKFLWSSQLEQYSEYDTLSTNSIDVIISDIFWHVSWIIDQLESEEVVSPVPLVTQYEYPVLWESFLFVSGWVVKRSNMSDYEYRNYEKYILEPEEKNFLTQEEFIWVIDISKTEYIIYYKDITYTYANFVHDIKWYGLYLVVLFFIVFFVIFLWVGIIFKPLSKNYASMDEFIHNAGHELKTPLASIMSSIGIMKKTKSYDEQIVSEVISETKKSNKMIEALRDISRIESPWSMERLYIWEKMREIVSTLQTELRKKNIDYVLDIREDFQIESDENHFYICISNILKNAIKYNKENGSIRVLIEKKKISIIDTGLGMTQAETKKVFERFYRSNNHRDGTGLWVGLFLVAKIAKIYKWKITISSALDEWTRVVIIFP